MFFCEESPTVISYETVKGNKTKKSIISLSNENFFFSHRKKRICSILLRINNTLKCSQTIRTLRHRIMITLEIMSAQEISMYVYLKMKCILYLSLLILPLINSIMSQRIEVCYYIFINMLQYSSLNSKYSYRPIVDTRDLAATVESDLGLLTSATRDTIRPTLILNFRFRRII